MLFRSGGACPGLLASISPSQQKDFISDKYHGVSAVDRLAAVDPVGSIGCGPSSVGARLCQSPSLDHLLESLGKGTSSCHLCGIREQWLPFTGSHAGNEDEGKQGQNANGAL
jgi:hypothetical protein